MVDESRGRVLDAARRLLSEPDGYVRFTVDTIARTADVARATVYYQFGSKSGLLEALCDSLADAAQIPEVGRAVAAAPPDRVLAQLIGGFARFWAVDRLVMRRLRALAKLDPDIGQVIEGRDERRRGLIGLSISRLATEGTLDAAAREALVATLHALTSFEMFDAIAAPQQQLADATDIVHRLAEAAVHTALDRQRA
jgi:AcrR family transcriptional regulator